MMTLITGMLLSRQPNLFLMSLRFFRVSNIYSNLVSFLFCDENYFILLIFVLKLL